MSGPPATFGTRIGATSIDTAVLFFSYGLAVSALELVLWLAGIRIDLLPRSLIGCLINQLPLVLILTVISWRGRTLGMSSLDLHLCDARTGGRPALWQ